MFVILSSGCFYVAMEEWYVKVRILDQNIKWIRQQAEELCFNSYKVSGW